MWDGVVIVEVKIDDRKGIVSHQGDGAADHAVESGSVLFRIGDAMITPKGIGPNGIPVLAQFPREAQVSMGGAVPGDLATENLNRFENNGIEACRLCVVDATGIHA